MPKFFEFEKQQATPLENQEQVFECSIDHLSPKIGESGEIETLLSWEAADRPFRPKDRSYYTTVAILVILLSLIAILAKEFLLIGVLLAMAFVAYVLAFIPPINIKYKISTQGVTIGDHFYFWHDLDSFWFKEKSGHKVLFIQTMMVFPGQLILVLGDIDQEEVKRLIARFLPYREIPRITIMDKWTETLQKHFPL